MSEVIPRDSAPPLSRFSFCDLERQAAQIVDQARAQAERILLQARLQAREAEQILTRRAYEEGLEQGRQAGLEQIRREARQAAVQTAQADLARLTQALTAALAQFDQNKRSLIAEAESGLIELAVAIARRVCKVLVERSVEPVRANVRALLEMVRNRANLELCLNPAEHELLTQVCPEFMQQISCLEHATIRPDPAVERGGCILRTSEGVIDANIQVQIDRIAEALGHGAVQPDGSRGRTDTEAGH